MKLEIRKKYGDLTALDVRLEIADGQITAILGESGAGKTTLLSAAAGLLPFDGSTDGVGRVSCLFQNPRLLPNLTAAGNLKFVLKKEDWGKIPEALARVGLGGRENSYPHELSGGECQRVAIARSFLYPHDTLLMDEPFSSLDLALKKSLSALIAELWMEKRSTVLFVTHDVHEAALLSSRALVLNKGRCVADIPVTADYPRDFFARFPEEELLVRELVGCGSELCHIRHDNKTES